MRGGQIEGNVKIIGNGTGCSNPQNETSLRRRFTKVLYYQGGRYLPLLVIYQVENKNVFDLMNQALALR